MHECSSATPPASNDVPPPLRLQVLREPGRVAAVLDPQRRRLLDALHDQPDSASGLARRLGEPRQRLNYHLRVLEEAGVVELHEERPRRGFVERVMRPTALRFVVDPEALNELEPQETEADSGVSGGDRLSATHVVGLSARTIREVAALVERARGEGKRLATFGLEAEVHLANPGDFRELVEELSVAVAGVVSRFDCQEPEARPFRLVITGHPGREHDERLAGPSARATKAGAEDGEQRPQPRPERSR